MQPDITVTFYWHKQFTEKWRKCIDLCDEYVELWTVIRIAASTFYSRVAKLFDLPSYDVGLKQEVVSWTPGQVYTNFLRAVKPSRYMSAYNQSPRSTQPAAFRISGVATIGRLNRVPACLAGVTAGGAVT